MKLQVNVAILNGSKIILKTNKVNEFSTCKISPNVWRIPEKYYRFI